jgi:hypothetical protein
VLITRDLVLPGPPERTLVYVDDLERYPQWMSLVHDVAAVSPAPSDPAGCPAWSVELRTHIGPLARSKRLRMVRTLHDPPNHMRFERFEIDGRDHAPWILEVRLTPTEGDERTTLAMSLSYGGRLWTGSVLQHVLDDEVTNASEALLGLVASG